MASCPGVRCPNTQHLITGDNTNADLCACINTAYKHQNYIGWGHFLHGHLLPITTRSNSQERDPSNPSLWKRKTVDQLWKFFCTRYLELPKWGTPWQRLQ